MKEISNLGCSDITNCYNNTDNKLFQYENGIRSFMKRNEAKSGIWNNESGTTNLEHPRSLELKPKLVLA